MRNPFRQMSPRWIRTWYVAFAAAVLALSLFNFLDVMVYKAQSNDQCAWIPHGSSDTTYIITDIVPGGVADRAGLRDGDILLEINGQRFAGPNQAMMLINAVDAGEQAVYTIERDGRSMQIRVEIIKTFDVAYFAQFLLGLGFLLVGVFVVLVRPDGDIQRKFGRYSILTMLFFAFASVSINPLVDPPWKVLLLIVALAAGRVFAPPAFVGFFMHFPVRKHVPARRSSVLLAWGLSIISAAVVIFGRRFELPGWIIQTAWFIPYGMYITGLGVFVHSYLASVSTEERICLRSILHSVIIGAAAFIYTLVIHATYPIALFINPVLYLPSLLIIGVPPAFGYAIIRYRLMDVQFIVKRSISYGIVTAALAAIYLVFVFGVGSVIGGLFGHSEDQLLTLIAFVVVALLFDPLKRRVQDLVDRFFFQDRYNYQRALLEFSRELPRLIDLEQILGLMIQRISSTMRVDVISVSLCSDKEGCSTVAMNIPDEFSHFEQNPDGLAGYLRRTRSPLSFALPAEEFAALGISDHDKEKIRRSGVVLSVPMLLQDTLIGTINVGEKKSGSLYSQEDIDLLSTVAGQAAIAIENARLHRTEIEKQKMEEELAIARRIQVGLLPKGRPDLPGLDVDGISRPAHSVGGDYFDFIRTGDDRLLVVVADVSGKGIPAALYMSKVQGMIQFAASMYDSPRDILTHVNRLIYDGMERNSFVTMILAQFDTTRRTVRMCRAGHPLPIVGMNAHLGFLETRGIGLGLEKGPLFDDRLEEFDRPYKPDELFVFYSDGLTEMMDRGRNEFGAQRLIQLVRANEDLDAESLKSVVVSTVSEYQGTAEQHDDLTLVVVRTR